MLGHKIENLLLPTINFYDSNEPNYFPNIYQITEQTTSFEKIINEMKANTKAKISLKDCSNPNCVNPFSGKFNTKECCSCSSKYCSECIKTCQNCNENICLFCCTIKYDNNRDIELCPNCAQNQ